MNLVRFPVLLSLVLAWLAACGPAAPSSGATGTMRLALAAPADVTRVTVTVSGADMAPRTFALVSTDGAWGGVLHALPAGVRRTFLAQAFDAASVPRYETRVEDVSILEGQTGLVTLVLQDLSAPASFGNDAPVIDSLVASTATVLPGGTVSLTAHVRDPNAGDSVSHTWTAPTGSFSPADQPNTVWTAPAAPGLVTLSLTVSDSRGAALTRQLPVNVIPSTGAEEIRVDFNSAPRVVALSATQSSLLVGQPTALSASATDPEGDALSYQWSATCAGGFTGGSTSQVAFTPSAMPAASACNNCQVRVVVTDGRGGQNTGTVSVCVAAAPIWSTQGSWNPTASMSTRRKSHQATALADGRVLVTGGSDGNAVLATAEVYDPDTGTWRSTGAMSVARFEHQAVRLSDGRVLVMGGFGSGSVATATAELYDPATGTWSNTGALNQARTWFASALLANGKVLVAGGYNSVDPFTPVYLATAEVYDPATGTWRNTGALSASRYAHAMTRLPSGKVLLSGGVNNGGNQTTAHLYDPATGTWSNTGSMALGRSQHTLTLLPNGTVLAAGANTSSSNVMTEVYDPAWGIWGSSGALGMGRYSHKATLLLNGKVLLSGGRMARDLMTTELYAPSTGWRAGGPMAWARGAHTATLLPDGRVLVTGGVHYNNTVISAAEVYDPGP